MLGYLRASGTSEPEDVLGEVFLQVARDGPRFRDAGDPEAVRRWVFAVARNRRRDAARRARRRPVVVEGDPPEGSVTAAEDGDGDPGLVAALAALPDDQREVVVLRFVADLSLEDVARLTRRSVGAVKAMQHRAMANLRAAVSPPGSAAL